MIVPGNALGLMDAHTFGGWKCFRERQRELESVLLLIYMLREKIIWLPSSTYTKQWDENYFITSQCCYFSERFIRFENRNKGKNTGLVVSRKPANLVHGPGVRFSFLSIIYACKSTHASNPPNPEIINLTLWIV